MLLACCAAQGIAAQHRLVAADAPNHAEASGGDEKYVASVSGRAGIAIAGRDKVELAHGTVYVNGQSWGKVPEPCQVRLEVTKQGRVLFVDGQVRNPPASP
jgi:hypothetical protein